MSDAKRRIAELNDAVQRQAAEIERLRYALRTVLGDADHGQNMTWEKRCRMGREALEQQEPKP